MKNYKKGKRILSVSDFEESVAGGNRLFFVPFGDYCVRHYGFIQSLQYGFIKNVLIPRGFYVAKKIEKEKENGRNKDNRSSKG